MIHKIIAIFNVSIFEIQLVMGDIYIIKICSLCIKRKHIIKNIYFVRKQYVTVTKSPLGILAGKPIFMSVDPLKVVSYPDTE